MPSSQLKRLKSSLREQGIVGPQQSKKQKKRASRNVAFQDKRIERNAALQGIREQFNPFEVRAPSRGSKFAVTSNNTIGTKSSRGILGRPGVTKGLGEENRRKTLLVEMQRRGKAGGILDQRFGENDPTMTPQEKALERFVKEKQKGIKRNSVFDLEDEDDYQENLTHLGQSLAFDPLPQAQKKRDDYVDSDPELSGQNDLDLEDDKKSHKRRQLSDSLLQGEDRDRDIDNAEVLPERRKPKQEVMREVIAKSKLHKYERRQAKEDDDDLRAILDMDLSSVLKLMEGKQLSAKSNLPEPAEKPSFAMDPDRAALLGGKDRSQADKEYDERLRQMAYDKRSQPTTRTKSKDEIFAEEALKLENLEEDRLRRMRGEEESGDEDGDVIGLHLQGQQENDLDQSEGDAIGLGAGILASNLGPMKIDVEDEDDFLIEDGLIANGSDLELSNDENNSAESNNSGPTDEEDREFISGLQINVGIGGRDGNCLPQSDSTFAGKGAAENLAYTFPCPQSHADLLNITKDVIPSALPTVVQRIRALYHPKLQNGNKEKLGVFSTVLVDHIAFLANQPEHTSFSVLESLIRHVHSLARSFPMEVSDAFRLHLRSLHETRPISPTPGDLTLFAAIATIFPTSDHFHQVVTPAILSIGRYLGQNTLSSLGGIAIGTYFGTLCLHYQRLSRRYIPELVNSTSKALSVLAPVRMNPTPKHSLSHVSRASLRIQFILDEPSRQLRFWDIGHKEGMDEAEDERLKTALLEANVSIINEMADLWLDKPAFIEMMQPALASLQHLFSEACRGKLGPTTTTTIKKTLEKLLFLTQQARISRRPLLLHHHRPLAIKTSIPKFEESYNPDKHYDPDRDRAEMSKLKAEHKREKKGALRELRKDANFIARESLREKKERDREYDKKYKRLVAEIQGEEGKEANEYEREKRRRKASRSHR